MSSPQSSEFLKNFSNAVVTWEVESFSLITSIKHAISSPPITLLVPTETRWRMHLEKLNKTLLLKVELLESKIFKYHIHLHWSYCILDESEKGMFSIERICTYTQKTNLNMGSIEIKRALEITSKKKYDNLIIKCRMLVDFIHPIQFPKLSVTGVEHLSNALRKLPTSFIYHNMTTTFRDVKFSLHEAMLFFRGVKLISLKKQSSSNAIDYGFNYTLDSLAAQAVLEYLYTGNLMRILKEPRLMISDYIQHLEIPGLEDVYSTERIKVSTKTELRKQTSNFTVSDFRDRTNTVFSEKIKIQGVKSFLQFSLKVKKSRNDPSKQYVYFRVMLIESELILALRLEVSFGKDKNQILCTRRFNGVMHLYEIWDGTVLEEDHAECFLNERLFIKVHVSRSVGDALNSIEVDENPPSGKIAYENYFMSLSETLGEMRKTAIHSDFYFKVGEHEIKSHKFLAAARSPLMEELLRRHEDLECVEVFDCTVDVFEKFLHYMYVGILTENNIDKLIEVYKFGEPYKVDGLLEDVLKILLKCINKANVLKILIFAAEVDDHELKLEAFTYVINNSNILINHKDLDMFRINAPVIYSEIKESLK